MRNKFNIYMKLIYLVVFLLLLANLACKDGPVAPSSANLQLTADDVGVTDAWLRLKTAGGVAGTVTETIYKPHTHNQPVAS